MKKLGFNGFTKRALAFVLAGLMCVLSVPVEGKAEENIVSYAVTGGNIYFDTTTGTVTDADDTTITEAIIPNTINGVSVVNIGDRAFVACDKLTRVSLPDGIISIGNSAFSNCKLLADFTIPSTVQSLGEYALSGTKIRELAVPESVTSIGKYAFSSISFDRLVINANITNLSERVFNNCTIRNQLTLPSTLREIEKYAFYKAAIAGITINEGLEIIGEGAFSYATVDEVILPDSVTEIGEKAFESAAIKKVKLPNGLKEIKQRTFFHIDTVKLTEITIPDSIEIIGTSAFDGQKNLTEIIIPEGVKTIGTSAFQSTGITEITIPSSVISIGKSAFSSCSKLETVTINSTQLTEIAESAFEDDILLTSINIPEGIESINNRAFYACRKLAALELPSTLETIGNEAFGFMIAEEFDIPSGVTSIGNEIFAGCFTMERLGLPASITALSTGNFYIGTAQTPKLKDIYYEGTKEQWNSIFNNDSNYSNTLNDVTIHYNSLLHDIDPDEDEDPGTSNNPIEVTIKFDVNGGEGSFEDIVKMSNETYGPLVEAYSPLREGYEFLGWSTVRNNKSFIVDEDTIVGKRLSKITLYATWSNDFYMKQIITTKYKSWFKKNDPYVNTSFEWDEGIFAKNAQTEPFNVDLAQAGILLSSAIEDSKNSIDSLLKEMQFENIRTYTENYAHYPDISFGTKTVQFSGKKKTLVVVVVRGTSSFSDASTDIWSQFNGFLDAGKNTLMRVKNRMDASGIDFDNSVFFITGHSLGGATAGQLTRLMIKAGLAKKDNIFTYTFASPNYDTEKDNYSDFNNVYNIINTRDTVPNVPVGYKRIGTDMRFDPMGSKLENSSSFNEAFIQLQGPKPGIRVYSYRELYNSNDLKNLVSSGHLFNAYFGMLWHLKDNVMLHHSNDVYYALTLCGEKPEKIYEKITYASIKCPVDVEVYNKSGSLMGSIKNNVVSHEDSSEVYLYTIGDEKYIVFLGDDPSSYTLRLTATGEGTMEYAMHQVLDATGTETVKTYSNVSLTPGKQMYSDTKGLLNQGVNATPLYVLNGLGNAVIEVKPDGTEVAIKEQKPQDVGNSNNGHVQRPGTQTNSSTNSQSATTSTQKPNTPSKSGEPVKIFRLYNPNTGSHFLTTNDAERDVCEKVGWKYEGVAFVASVEGIKVYRLYNPVTGEHFYTISESEKNACIAAGWKFEGTAFNSSGINDVYRLYHGGRHLFTTNKIERDNLISLGWKYEGVGFKSN